MAPQRKRKHNVQDVKGSSKPAANKQQPIDPQQKRRKVRPAHLESVSFNTSIT